MAKEANKRTVRMGGGDRIEVRDINVPTAFVDVIVEGRVSEAGIVYLSLGSTIIDGEQDNYLIEAVVTHRIRMTQRTALAVANQLTKLAGTAIPHKKQN